MFFTRIALGLAAAGVCLGQNSHTWAISACLLCGCCASFYAAPLFDMTAYARMRARHKMSPLTFHVGNAILHAAPLVLIWKFQPIAMAFEHGVAAVAIHLLWALLDSAGSMCCDATYVYMAPRCWACLWTIAFSSEMLCACVLK